MSTPTFARAGPPDHAALGQPVDRVDGPAKVTGSGRYSGEIPLPGLVYAVVVGATVPCGRIDGLDATHAEKAEGVLAVLTHRNLPAIVGKPVLVPSVFGHAAPGESFFPLQDEQVHYAGQPVAVVVADTHERAEYAASLVRVHYRREPAVTTLDEGREQAYEPEAIFGGFIPGRTSRGDVNAGLTAAEVGVDRTYHFDVNHHHPMEPSTTTAQWDGDQLTLYDSTQGITASRLTVATLLGIPVSKVRVITKFVGGGFGCKAMTWPHVTLAAMAARQVGRPVRLALTRRQMFTSCGHREEQEQRVELGASADGHLTAMRHHKLSLTSPFDDWAEPSLNLAVQYDCPNYEGVYHLIHGNTMTPTFTRGPGETSGMFAVECAMDELAYEVGVDPLELRLRNRAEVDPVSGKPWSSRGLLECYQVGADRFGWSDRDPTPRARRDGRLWVGTGMASAGYPVVFPTQPQRARARVYADGSAVVQAGTQDFGTGAATAMTQVAADGLGLPVRQVRFEYGDTDLPTTAAAVASAGSGMVSAAVHNAAVALRDRLVGLACADADSPLHGTDPASVVVSDGRMARCDSAAADTTQGGETYAKLLDRHGVVDVEATGTWTPPGHDVPYALATFGAQFAEVAVDADLGEVRVRRMVGVFAPGRVLNPKTARSQLLGGMLWGLGQALLEGTVMDPIEGRWSQAGLGDYLIPVNADAPDVDIQFVDVTDE
ncbi:MAG TPA: xanthine dehydrogenase family protein molybdopterin-binding subunit, partial [Actinopolymorphaceae bacterium]|nr:xanthine dehydrogenase family protein molybdopterin-binding subunit [Actinopolymorphaceae bacterium]